MMPVLVGLVAVTSACSLPPGGGPLAGPRVEKASVEICSPAGLGRQVYFGEPFTNEGSEPLEITEVSGDGDNLASVEHFVDVEGPSLGERLGSFAWPVSEGGSGVEERVFARMSEAVGTRVPGNTQVMLIIKAKPKSAQQSAVVKKTVVKYKVHDREYREESLVEYETAPGEIC